MDENKNRGVEQRREQTERDNEEANKRMHESRPTPTQAENDLAKVGALDLTAPKEDHGAEDETEALRKQQQRKLEATSAAPYQTRDMPAGETREQREEREKREREEREKRENSRARNAQPQAPKTA